MSQELHQRGHTRPCRAVADEREREARRRVALNQQARCIRRLAAVGWPRAALVEIYGPGTVNAALGLADGAGGAGDR